MNLWLFTGIPEQANDANVAEPHRNQILALISRERGTEDLYLSKPSMKRGGENGRATSARGLLHAEYRPVDLPSLPPLSF